VPKSARRRQARTCEDGTHRRWPPPAATLGRRDPVEVQPASDLAKTPAVCALVALTTTTPNPLRVTSEKKERRLSRRETAYVIGRGKAILWRSGKLFKGQRGAEILSTGGWLTSINSAVGRPLQVTEGPAGAGPAAYFLP
jgi:hypothetical protein